MASFLPNSAANQSPPIFFARSLFVRMLDFLARSPRLKGILQRINRQAVPSAGIQALQPNMPPIWYLDLPDITKKHQNPKQFVVKGWIASVHPITGPFFELPHMADAIKFDVQPGTDVAKIFGMPAIRFIGSCPMSMVQELKFINLFFETNSEKHEIIVPIHKEPLDMAAQKAKKFARLLSLVACPVCKGNLEFGEQKSVCASCGLEYPRDNRHFNFLPQLLAKEAAIAPTDNVSSNLYNGACLNYIHSLPNGLILDCGAGCKNKTYENVVNLEIADYESTDVLAVAEHLPFKDNVFDVVFSFAVLEHVRNPANAAREMARVLKPGGTIFCQAPFLAPLHAYPHHYFNMTKAGLASLFDGLVDIEQLAPLLFGQPVHALAWLLTAYTKGLPPALSKQFMDMRVRDLLTPADHHLGAPFVACLSAESREELAMCNYIIARKPSAITTSGA